MSTGDFFDETTEQSIIKGTIVEKYFDTWATIIASVQSRSPIRKGNDRLGYIDLFAGPGRYKSGAASTPLRVLQRAIEKPELAKRLVTVFNDKDKDNVSTLAQEIDRLPGIERLAHRPIFWNEELGEDGEAIVKAFQSMKDRMPVLAFIDPWGYKGLTLHLVDAFLREWGCDCIFFFNYARINAGLSNPKVATHMAALFGFERAEQLSTMLDPMSPTQREATIINGLAEALKGYAAGHGTRYVLPFCFKNEEGTRTKHHLVLVTKHFKGYDVMKDIMAKASSSHDQGVASFTFSPADSSAQQLLFALSNPIGDLGTALLTEFAGRRLTMREVYEQHSVGRPYISKNYKDALMKLLEAGQITTDRLPKRGFADNIVVTFPPRKR